MKVALIFSLFLMIFSGVATAADQYAFQSKEQRQQFERITSDMRCMVCQNKSLASSASGFAQEMRGQIYKMVKAGKTDKQITDYMAARYGYFVSFSPPFFWKTYLLWLGSILFLIFMVLFGRSIYRKHRNQN
ncbi:MAG: cytochrome c-type biogenesis protein CcmH [Coxiellaceae bacterium]|nr:cytochrome c-type biogenesis protein CcmH [Coxiellaceae bacterium]